MKNLLFFISLFVSSNIVAQQYHSVRKNYLSFADSNYFEKIYLHTDKDVYYTNENIWFKAYVFNAKKGKIDSCKQLMFIDFINPEKKIIFTEKYWLKNGISFGNIFLPDSLNQGTYLLRAYTFPMKNFSSQFFFSKNIFIYSKKQNYSLFFFQDAKKLKHKKKIIYLDYKIVSGNMIVNLPCKIIYYLKNFKKDSISCHIFVVDKNNKIIAERQNSYSGKLTFIPKNNNKYFIIVKKENYHRLKIILPKPKKNGIVIIPKIFKNKIILKFNSKQMKTKDFIAKTYLLFGEANGKIVFTKFFLLDSTKIISINKKKLIPGIINFSLINLNNKIVASVPVFISLENKNPLKISAKHKNDTLFVKINSTKKINVNLSLSLTSTKNHSHNIKQYFNFFSEISYLSNNYSTNKNNVQKWTELYYKEKYPLNKIIKNQYHRKIIQPKKEIYISGEIKFLNEEIPAKFGKLTFTNLNEFNDIFNTTADKKGRFIFHNLNYTDSIDFIITAVSRRHRKYIIINLDEYEAPKIFFNAFSNFDSIKISRQYIFRDTSLLNFKTKSEYNLHPEQIITGKEIDQWGGNNVLDALNGRVPGYRYANGKAQLKPRGNFQINEPLYLLNDLPTDAETIAGIPANLINRIEIIKNPSDGVMFGDKGSNGIIAVYTLDYSNFKWGEFKGKIAGISVPKKFHRSKYLHHFYTYKWIPEIKMTKHEKIIKIPLKQGTKVFLNIQGFANNSPVYFYSEIKR